MVFNENGIVLNEGFFKTPNPELKKKYKEFEKENIIPGSLLDTLADPSISKEKKTEIADNFSKNYSRKYIEFFKKIINECNSIQDYKWLRSKISKFIKAEKQGKAKTTEFIDKAEQLLSQCDQKIQDLK